MSEFDVARFHVRCALLSLSYFGQGYSQIVVVAGTAIVDIAAPVCSCHCDEGEEGLKEMHTRKGLQTKGVSGQSTYLVNPSYVEEVRPYESWWTRISQRQVPGIGSIFRCQFLS